jgi:hypothetical protein
MQPILYVIPSYEFLKETTRKYIESFRKRFYGNFGKFVRIRKVFNKHMRHIQRSILLLTCLTVLFFASCVETQEKQCVNQMDRWSSGNEMNLSGAVKSVRVEKQIYEFEGDFIYKHDKKPLLKERFEFDRQGREIEDYTYTIDGRESPKSVSSYNEKNWLIKNDTFSALSNKPYLQTRYVITMISEMLKK